MMIVLTSVFSV